MYKYLTKEEIKKNLYSFFYQNLDGYEYRREIDLAVKVLLDTNIKCIDSIDEKGVLILRERFGINIENRPKTLEDIGQTYNVNRANIFRRQKTAFKTIIGRVMSSKSFLRIEQLDVSEDVKKYIFCCKEIKSFNSYFDIINDENNKYAKEIENAVFKYLKTNYNADYLNTSIDNLLLNYQNYFVLKEYNVNNYYDMLTLSYKWMHSILLKPYSKYTFLNNILPVIYSILDKNPLLKEENSLDNEFIESLGLDMYHYRILKRNGINTVKQLKNISLEQLSTFKGVGPSFIETISDKICCLESENSNDIENKQISK